MRRVAWICIAWISAMGMAQAQSGFDLILDKEGKIVALPKNKTYELRIPKVSYQTFTPRGSRDVDIKLRELAPVSQAETTLPEHPMDMRISSAAYQPFFNIYTPMIREVSPMALDFNETYIKRLNDLEQLAMSYPGVTKTYAIQAGRELRVIVGADKIDDKQTESLSGEIAKKIQDEMTYPGQVKITVIRETRAVSYAK